MILLTRDEEKQDFPIRLTFGGIEIDRNEDREKQLSLILINCENGSNVNVSSCSQSEKQDLPSIITEDGI
jgi:hypothetical protein